VEHDADTGTDPAWPELPEGRPRTMLDLAAAKLRAALQERESPGYVLVTAENPRASEALYLRIEPELAVFRSLRVSGRKLVPEEVVAELWRQIEPKTAPPRAAMRILVDRARAAGQPVIVAIADADDADASQLEKLRVMLEAAPDASEIVRIVLLGGSGLVELLRKPDARALAIRIGATISVPTATQALANASVVVTETTGRRGMGLGGVIGMAAVVGIAALVLVGLIVAVFSVGSSSEQPVAGRPADPPAVRLVEREKDKKEGEVTAQAVPPTVVPRTVPPATTPPVTAPPVTIPPSTAPSPTVAPATEPPATTPPTTTAPATTAPATTAPATATPPTTVPRAADAQPAAPAGERAVQAVPPAAPVLVPSPDSIPAARIEQPTATTAPRDVIPPAVTPPPTTPAVVATPSTSLPTVRPAVTATTTPAGVAAAPPTTIRPATTAAPTPPPTIAPVPPAAARRAPEPSPAVVPKPASPPAPTREPETPIAKATKPEPDARTAFATELQVGAFRNEDNAEALRAKLAGRFQNVTVSPVTRDGRTLHLVRVGGFRSEQDLGLAAAALRTDGHKPIRVRP
jgi:cell division septation protein DedD